MAHLGKKPIFFLTFTLVTFLLMASSSCDADPIDEEKKCLQTLPGDLCSLTLTYPDPVKAVGCDVLVPTSETTSLQQAPVLAVPNKQGMSLPVPVLIYMFDIDVPKASQGSGFVHWVATATLNEDGSVSDIEEQEGQGYYPPTPPPGPEHRYQVFLFPFNAQTDTGIAPHPSHQHLRQDVLCDFVNRNQLQAPLAATQFRFQN